MKMMSILLLSLSIVHAAPLFAANTYYIHLEGTAPQVTPAAIFQKFDDVFLEPLGPSGKITSNSYFAQVNGPENHFVFNFVFEALNVISKVPLFSQLLHAPV